MADYTYSITTDFVVGNGIDEGKFHMEVSDSSIGPKYDHVSVSGDTVTVNFTSALVGGETEVLDAIVAAHDGTAAADIPLYGYVTGLRVSNNPTNPTYQIDVEKGAIMADSPSIVKLIVSATLTADITVTGAGGRNVETAEQADKWYAIFVIGSVAGAKPVKLFLVNEDDLLTFAMPSGYDALARVGRVRNDGSSNLLNFVQRGNGSTRRIWYLENVANTRVLTNGNATSFAAVALVNFVPPNTDNVIMRPSFSTGTGGGASTAAGAFMRPTGDPSTTPAWRIQPGVHSTSETIEQIEMPCNSSQSIDYQVTDAANALTLSVLGYDDELQDGSI